jgi:hypothetical protein
MRSASSGVEAQNELKLGVFLVGIAPSAQYGIIV